MLFYLLIKIIKNYHPINGCPLLITCDMRGPLPGAQYALGWCTQLPGWRGISLQTASTQLPLCNRLWFKPRKAFPTTHDRSWSPLAVKLMSPRKFKISFLFLCTLFKQYLTTQMSKLRQIIEEWRNYTLILTLPFVTSTKAFCPDFCCSVFFPSFNSWGGGGGRGRFCLFVCNISPARFLSCGVTLISSDICQGLCTPTFVDVADMETRCLVSRRACMFCLKHFLAAQLCQCSCGCVGRMGKKDIKTFREDGKKRFLGGEGWGEEKKREWKERGRGNERERKEDCFIAAKIADRNSTQPPWSVCDSETKIKLYSLFIISCSERKRWHLVLSSSTSWFLENIVSMLRIEFLFLSVLWNYHKYKCVLLTFLLLRWQCFFWQNCNLTSELFFLIHVWYFY